MGVEDIWVLLLIVIGCCFFRAQAQSPDQNLKCDPNDLKALQAFLAVLQTSIPGWETNSSSNCCTWTGVKCNSSSSLGFEDGSDKGRVVKLELQGMRLMGKLSETLGSLDQLKTLNLSRNFLKGPVPFSLFNLSNLEAMDLSFNDFNGPVPDTFHLPSIQVLDMSQNYLNGPFPTGVCNAASSLRVLKLAANFFTGVLPSELGDCGSLEHICVGMNYLTSISEGIFRLRKLSDLILQDNKFSGSLSKGIGNLTKLVRLDICSNEFSGPIPDVFHNLKNLRFFVAHSNKFTGDIPPSLSNSPSLTLLNVRNNSLDGPIRLNCTAMVSLASLDLATNRFTGAIPDNLPSCQHLNNINIARNNFTGEIPESFKNFHSLSYFSLSNSSNSNLYSALRILQQCKNLTTLVLSLNFRDEELPADPTLYFEKLKILVIANCRLRGLVPQWLSASKQLQLLDLSWNQFVGTIPPWLGDFQDLFYLDLSNNSFSGEIPESLTRLPSLIDRQISLEEPSPDFPFFMKRNVSARGLQYNQVWSFPPTLDLSCNNLSGPIWPEFGNLRKLHIFELRFNNLTGSIPSSLAGMSSLETLDLSHNKLSGTIPSSLVRLSFLSKLNVANNQLHGTIPVGGQFPTFPNSSFEGNNLCGEHASPCASSESLPHQPSSGSGKKRGVVVGITIGIVFGTALFLAFMFIFVLRKHHPGEIDPEKEDGSTNEKDLEELGSRLVTLFQNKDNCKELSVDDVLKSTNNFDQANIIGCGGFGLVYRATLPDGKKVAIKRLSGDCGQMEREFRAEVETLSRAQHPNLVLLQGYCMFKSDRLLIYSYMENSSLDYWLHERVDGPAFLKWETRLQIARGAARGLAYLHQSCEPHILHRDIKSSNILLDENFEAHLADFGLARLILPYDTHVTTDLVGTLGYIPPEYGQASVATYKGDVYSFGVVLLELLTGKRPMDMCKPKSCRDLISWVFQMKKEKRESEVFDPFICDKEHDKELLQVLEIACLCLSEFPKVRPSTQQLVSWLDSIGTNI
ncbi:Serine/threonine protein kinase [Parasponia andersonii]|uniref:non-specific serine/threonine protein kinase n=1 Tax=Parasponia andersonii TaxID=3476 RepID=A0A2P5BN80_PARAD|nr:Serine/threonine protein kinase [Parasponia andersonii]